MENEIWINNLDDYAMKVEGIHQDYILWVKRIQGNFYRIFKISGENKNINNLSIIALKHNYKSFFENNIEKHIQRLWLILEKFNDMIKNDNDYNDVVEKLFGMTANIAKIHGYKIKRRDNK